MSVKQARGQAEELSFSQIGSRLDMRRVKYRLERTLQVSKSSTQMPNRNISASCRLVLNGSDTRTAGRYALLMKMPLGDGAQTIRARIGLVPTLDCRTTVKQNFGW